MALGIKIHCPYPLSLKGAAMPHAYISIEQYFIACTITPSDTPKCKIHNKKSQTSIASFLEAKLSDVLELTTHDLIINIKHAGIVMEKTFSAISACIHHANEFFKRKYHPVPFALSINPSYPEKLFDAGKFCFLTDYDAHHLPYPSGLDYALFHTKEILHPQTANDKNAFLLSESLYEMEYSGLPFTSIPNHISSSFENGSEFSLIMLPIVETQEVLGVFINTAMRDSFIDIFKKSYIGDTNLNLDGIIVV